MLNIFWFVLIAILFIGYFILEGFDYGVGMLYPVVGQSDHERRIAVNTIGPIWSGNEVWLITAGGALFAAFPKWYATLFSGFYVALVLMLVGLIFRGVAIEYRSKITTARWHKIWDILLRLGSFLPALLWGVAFANLIKGVPINQAMNDVGGFWSLISPYTVLGGLLTLLLFLAQGASFLTLKTTGDIRERSLKLAKRLLPVALVVAVGFGVWTATLPTVNHQGLYWLCIALGWVSLLGARMIIAKREKWAFLLQSLMIALMTAGFFLALFPRVMISTIAARYDLTIYSAASNPYTLHVMTIVALTMVPIVLAYQIWTYWIFRKRLTLQDHLEY
ncbi:MAG: cytochrome d ubiquinol oxidase subunit II [Firmicutes bacterium]|jgi:cytochrome d ubiquinol oxidase subunit II|uniref:Cytochrome d ubiquinol oxidase subunit II n=1 Tax=Sulfobacillus benefaciens TaxID=453960 RepID=A0A2T2X9R8_9FIRM|nr:cytochrome d ubiquinol oxidase subunit II [Bacillota bacterium]MCL5013318.1 cytochrome d ubiquinol oxidase subunit II [Bacillota bacterium]PSR31261.1 MAG: cytochrome d ubiquinol oxidase subunit II [Sulfobacillus benefaciens]